MHYSNKSKNGNVLTLYTVENGTWKKRETNSTLFMLPQSERRKAVRATTAAHRICKSLGPGISKRLALTTAQACGWRGATSRASFVMVAQPQREREHRWLRLDGRMVWQSQTS